jgi:uncharacterized protein
MSLLFADSYYFFALGNVRDPAHGRAVAFSLSFAGKLLTTDWIIMELGDGMVQPAQRPVFLRLVEQFHADPDMTVIPFSAELMTAGIDLFRRRSDKEWSLTDCVSFVAMQREGITEALTGDRHFEQAGFRALLKS